MIEDLLKQLSDIKPLLDEKSLSSIEEIENLLKKKDQKGLEGLYKKLLEDADKVNHKE